MSFIQRKKSAFPSLGLLAGCGFLVSACIEVDKLIPSTSIDIVSSDGNLLQYVPNVCPGKTVAKIAANHAKVTSNVARLALALPPEIAQNSIVIKLVNQSQYVSARAVQTASLVLTNPITPPTAEKPPSDVTPSELVEFGKLVLDQVLRHTPSTTAATTTAALRADPIVVDQFWNDLKAYYAFYFQGQFNTYLGQFIPAPSPSLTITDTEIVQASQVFVEFLFDEIFRGTVWSVTAGKTTTYYPGGTTNKPTYMKVYNVTATPLPTTTAGCGMNQLKAQAIDSLVKEFGTAASAEVGLVVKSAGAIELGLGVLGKFSIGDNNLLSELAKGFATEVVARLTIELGVPILSAIDFQQQSAIIANVKAPLATGLNKSPSPAKTSVIRAITSPFVSANVKPL